MVFLAGWTDPAKDTERIQWLRDYHQALSPYSEPGGYINFMQDDDYGRIRDSYRQNYDRLVQVKRAYDPGNPFHITRTSNPDCPGPGQPGRCHRCATAAHAQRLLVFHDCPGWAGSREATRDGGDWLPRARSGKRPQPSGHGFGHERRKRRAHTFGDGVPAILGLPPRAGHPPGPATASSMQAIRSSSTYRPPRKNSSHKIPSTVKPHDS
jgi:hypothetical protein